MARPHVLSVFALLIAAVPAVAVEATRGVRTADHSADVRIASCGRPPASGMSRGDVGGARRHVQQAPALDSSNTYAQASPDQPRTWDPDQPRTWDLPPLPSGPRCRLDQIVFKDMKSRRDFVAERVAVDYIYLCGNLVTERYSKPEEAPECCLGPFGDTIIEGKLGTVRVYAVFTRIKGVPGESWHSYLRREEIPHAKIEEWLRPNEVPVIHLDDRRYIITSFWDDPDEGPLRGGEFIPVCRSQ
jgi:hypothetical protein